MRAVMPFPVIAGKSEADIRRIAERFRSDPTGYWEERRRLGVTLERAFWQHTPMGDFVVAYIEANRNDPGELFAAQAQATSELGRFFNDTLREVHGIDITQPPAGPTPEPIAEWMDREGHGTQRGFAFCAPMVAEQLDYAREWARRTWADPDFARTRRELGENKEIVWLTHTPQGPVASVYLEGRDPEQANRDFAASTDPFNVEFKRTLKRIFPPYIDFDQPVPGITEIFDSEKVPVPAG